MKINIVYVNAIVFVAVLAILLVMAWSSLQWVSLELRYWEEGMTTNGTVVSNTEFYKPQIGKWSRTDYRRVQYTYRDNQGQLHADADDKLYQDSETGDQIQIQYLASDPGFSRLAGNTHTAKLGELLIWICGIAYLMYLVGVERIFDEEGKPKGRRLRFRRRRNRRDPETA